MVVVWKKRLFPAHYNSSIYELLYLKFTVDVKRVFLLSRYLTHFLRFFRLYYELIRENILP
ncbi:Uncharacterised protein [uncultured archaeon]|nr:Uncharacterised protein [uncultured archaeon]